MVKASIIIPVKEVNDYVRMFIPKILKQNFQDFEIILLPDKKTKERFPRTKVTPSGPGGPAMKRDLGAKHSKGEILAFIDDDAYPEKGWLDKAISHFENKDVGAVGGPNLTPRESNLFQRLSGEVLSSWMVSGPAALRYKSTKIKEVDDLPSCNLFVRKSLFNKLQGFDTSFWPGEDTKLCFDIKQSGKKIIYDPQVLVYHHRRENLSKYIKQIYSYALHRGYFMKKYPETSFKLSYLMPSLFTLGLFFGPFLFLFSPIFQSIYLEVIALYAVLLIISALIESKITRYASFILLSFITHIVYGFGILQGLSKKELRSKYRK